MNINNDLRIAAAKGDAESVRSLLLHPQCNTLSTDPYGYTALRYAVREGHVVCVQLLCASLPLERRHDVCDAALMWASAAGHVSCVELLLPMANALAKDFGGKTALMWAAQEGHRACVQILLPMSAFSAKSNKGFTASELACDNGFVLLAEFMRAYALAKHELTVLGASSSLGCSHKSTSLRV